ncbi:MAG TPA: cytochrome-c oxidase, cbb3-type subunit III [Paracoccaceae bacterium]|nr:cytochrome-c oxidase, cbb3-type subunit III [Paracoccaceae bacterium]
MADKHKKDQVDTTGHEWDGIEELDTPMPRWWLWTFYLTIIWAIGYVIAYPAFPLVSGATKGLLGYSSRAEVAADIESINAANKPFEDRIVALELDQISSDGEVGAFAMNGGGAIFKNSCAQCHGAGAAGAKGYPNLLDNDWLWGGSIDDIHTTITHGIRNENDPDARYSEMPAFGDILEKPEIAMAAQYVLSLSGNETDAAAAAAGAEVFADNCAACHGDDGTGDREQGAPNLTDAIWLWGGDLDTVTATITNSRFGVMPSWGDRLTEAQIRQVAVYVHQLGGGE